jgi:serine/threonine-protein kinase
MSDFLSKFTKSEYDKTVEEKEVLVQSEPPHKKDDKEKKSKEEKKKEKKLAKQLEMVPEDIEEPTPVVVSTRRSSHVEETTIDPSYKANQRKKWIGAIVGVVLFIALGTAFYYFINQVKIPDYVGKPVSELKAWANRNDVTLEISEVFSLEVSKDYIISMDPLANTKIQKGSNMKVAISKGADPDEQILVPDFTGNTYFQIQEWLSTNKINNLRITYEYNDEIPSNEYVRIVFNDKNIKPETYTRKDYGLIYISNGPEVFTPNIEVPDWTTAHQDVSIVQAWANQNQIDLTIIQVSSNVVVNGVVSQSVAPKAMVAKKSKMTVTISQGENVIVPDFSEIKKDDVAALNPSGYTLRFVEMYQPNGGATYGSLIWQDVKAGTRISPMNTKEVVVTVYYSLGQPYLTKLGSEREIPEFIYNENLKSANFTYEIQYVSDAAEKGTVIEMTPFNQFVDPGQHIIFKVSSGS